LVIIRLRRVLPAIDLDDEAVVQIDEVDDIAADGMLPAELSIA
jgi:hypothetical protein